MRTHRLNCIPRLKIQSSGEPEAVACSLLRFVFLRCPGLVLPLHITGRSSCSTSLQRHYVVNDVTGGDTASAARRRAAMASLEFASRCGTPLDPPMGISLTGGAIRGRANGRNCGSACFQRTGTHGEEESQDEHFRIMSIAISACIGTWSSPSRIISPASQFHSQRKAQNCLGRVAVRRGRIRRTRC